MIKRLKFAFEWRRQLGLFEQTEAARIFYGPGETEHVELKKIAIEIFGSHAWVTAWEPPHENCLSAVCEFLRSLRWKEQPLQSIVLMDRSRSQEESDDGASEVRTLWGNPPEKRFSVLENDIPYLVQFSETKHPGLFLDHASLRSWLTRTQRGKKVLNLFSYTGSLSVAAGRSCPDGTTQVTSVDLSKATSEWAQQNWANAGLTEPSGNFIYGDVFDWLPRLAKKQNVYDTILCDPPSFSRSKSGVFSTQKDVQKLHELIFPLLAEGGILMSSINSENISEGSLMKDISAAAESSGVVLRVLKRLDLPESFPTSARKLSERYLKGFYFLRER